MGENTGNRWNLGLERGLKTDPNYANKNYGEELPPLTAFGNINYQQLMDLMGHLWEKIHPELKFVPYGDRNKYNKEIGYIAYSLENKKPSENNSKPQQHHDIVTTDTEEFLGTVYIQTFDHLIEFFAIHEDPRTSEGIMSAFEDFMLATTPVLKSWGAQDIFYTRRTSERDLTRTGEDIASRSVIYLVKLQKQVVLKPAVIEEIHIDARTFLNNKAPSYNSIIYLDIKKATPDL
jgi:hypothetical protein